MLAQRLIRMLCPYCKRQYHPTDDGIAGVGPATGRASRDDLSISNVGCDACNHTGYRGRTAIHELLDLSDNIREMIVERRPGSEVRRAAEAEGLDQPARVGAEEGFCGSFDASRNQSRDLCRRSQREQVSRFQFELSSADEHLTRTIDRLKSTRLLGN